MNKLLQCSQLGTTKELAQRMLGQGNQQHAADASNWSGERDKICGLGSEKNRGSGRRSMHEASMKELVASSQEHGVT